MTGKRIVAGLIILLISGVAGAAADEYYYAIEQSGTVCGYAHSIIEEHEIDNRSEIRLIDSLWIQLSALGKEFEGNYRFEYHIDPATGMYFYHESDIDQGPLHIGCTLTVTGDTVNIVSIPDGDVSNVVVSPGTIFQNTKLYSHLVNWFVRDTLSARESILFSEVDGAENDVLYRRIGLEEIEIAGEVRAALLVELLNRTTGIQAKLWIDPSDGLLLKISNAMRDIYLADPSIVSSVKSVDHNEKILASVDTVITNPWSISFMKVSAEMQPGGMWLTPESLNVPGQRFDGTVEDNYVDGVFEISHKRYDGSAAPPFPCDFSSSESLDDYLRPQDFIESDSPVLIEKAQEITLGAGDSWEAATRLSRWVNENIGYDIPGGGTALRTYELRLGECGSHANLLAAFCRAVGIPARCVFGCMYVPDHGGVFGQHAWNEIYMGDAGWIPVDCTVDEVSYVDCSHIRLGEWISKAVMLNPVAFEILECKADGDAVADIDLLEQQIKYNRHIGKYRGPEKVLTVLISNGHLALDIPGQMVFDLKDPSEDGEWYFALTNRVSVSFDYDNSGNASTMTINSRQRLPRADAGGVEEDNAGLPEEYGAIVGVYDVPMQNVSFGISYDSDELFLEFPGKKRIALESAGSKGSWIADTGKSKLLISFDGLETGRATGLSLSELVVCPRIE